MRERVLPLFLTSVVCLFLFFFPSPSAAQNRLTASQAIKDVKSTIDTPGWEIAFLSTTGVTESFLGDEFENAKGKAFLYPDGTAGQWIVELYRNTPKPVSEKGRSGYAYPFTRILVTAKAVYGLDRSEL